MGSCVCWFSKLILMAGHQILTVYKVQQWVTNHQLLATFGDQAQIYSVSINVYPDYKASGYKMCKVVFQFFSNDHALIYCD